MKDEGCHVEPVALSKQLKNRANPHVLHTGAECLINFSECVRGGQRAHTLEQLHLLPWSHLLQRRVPKPVAEHKSWNEKTGIHVICPIKKTVCQVKCHTAKRLEP